MKKSMEKQAIPIPKVKEIIRIIEKQAIPIYKVKEVLEIIEKQATPIPEVKEVLQIIEKQAILIPRVKRLLQIIDKQAIHINKVKEIIQIIEKQATLIPDVKEVLQIIETAKAIPKKEFEPSMKTLLRIMKSMAETGSDVKTSLALKTKLNYGRLAKHITWLEKKGLVESTISDQKIYVTLTQKGKIFGTMLLT